VVATDTLGAKPLREVGSFSGLPLDILVGL
jgi:hypothetical protein